MTFIYFIFSFLIIFTLSRGFLSGYLRQKFIIKENKGNNSDNKEQGTIKWSNFFVDYILSFLNFVFVNPNQILNSKSQSFKSDIDLVKRKYRIINYFLLVFCLVVCTVLFREELGIKFTD